MIQKSSSAFCKIGKVWLVIVHDKSNGRCIALFISLSLSLSLILYPFLLNLLFVSKIEALVYDIILKVYFYAEREGDEEDVKLGR